MNNIETTAQLLDLLRANQPKSAEDVDKSTIRYALYARKSTTDEERQERSTEDQIRDCMERVVIVDKLNLAQDPIQENYSAKEPDVRPKFRKLIEDIKSGRVTGIIAWHPDRLARNMKEAGEIIDLLDKGTLKDLRFATSTFENNPTGKMLLGISFVLSKQYSEHLSESVTRGNKRTTEDGEFIGKLKHGYYINEDRRLFPDGENFLLIKNAFQMRLNGATQKEIANWLNSTSYQVRRYKKDPTRFEWDKDNVSKVLRDPVYAGVMKYGKHHVDLSTLYNFQPIVTVKEFLKLNKISSMDASKLVSANTAKGIGVRADLLRGIVVCGYCNKTFSSGLTSKQLKSGPVHYYHYKCETEDCLFRNKSVRAKVVVECAISFFQNYLFITKDNYDQYLTDAKKDIQVALKSLNSEIASLSKQSGEKAIEYENTKMYMLNNPHLAKHYDLDKLKGQNDRMKGELVSLKNKRQATKDAIFTFEKYLELFNSVSVILGEMHDMKAMDKVLRKFFSNFTIKDLGRGVQQRYEITYNLNEPWLGFIKNGKFVYGRLRTTLIEPWWYWKVFMSC